MIIKERSLLPPEDVVIAKCTKCGGEIYEGEAYGQCYDKVRCIDCIEDEWRDLSNTEKITLLGYEVMP